MCAKVRNCACGSSSRKHHRPHDGKREDRCGESERDHAHAALLKVSRCTGEEEHGSKQDGIREVLTGNIAGAAGFLLVGLIA